MAQYTFQEQLVSIMEIVAKAAVAEINRRVEDSCAVIRIELARSQSDIDALKKKCQVMENELRKARGRGRRKVFLCGTSEKLSLPCQPVCPREAGVNVTRAEQRVTLREAVGEPSTQHNHQTEEILDITPDPPVIKQEANENRTWSNGEVETQYLSAHQNNTLHSPALKTHEEQNQLHEDMTRTSTHMQPLLGSGKSEEVNPGGLRLQVKSEKEDEEEKEVPEVVVEQRINETQNLEFALEREKSEVQLWSQIPESEFDRESERTEKSFSSAQISCDFAVFSQHLDTSTEHSGNDVHAVEGAQMELYNADWCRNRQQRSSLVSQRTRHGGAMHLKTQQQNGTPNRPGEVNVRTGSGTGTGTSTNTSNVVAPPLWGCGGRGGIGAVRRLRTHWRSAATGERRFSCSFCERRFARFGQLKEHLRSHTGERPYTCAQCGRSFTKQGNLIRHAVVHSGEKPYQCSLCGRRFTQRSSLKSHQKMHTADRDGSLQGLSMYESVRDPRNSLTITQTGGFP